MREPGHSGTISGCHLSSILIVVGLPTHSWSHDEGIMSLFCLARDARSKELDASDAERDAEDAGRVGCELGVGRDEYRDAEAACPGLSGPLVRFCQTHESLLSSEPERSRVGSSEQDQLVFLL